MKQLDLFTKKPSLEVGKAYRVRYGFNLQHSKDFYVANIKYHGDPWERWTPISYFIITENDIASMESSCHDCGGYIWQTGSNGKVEFLYRCTNNIYTELVGDELISFISKLRDKNIRAKFDLSP